MDSLTELNQKKFETAVHKALTAWGQIGGTDEDLLAFLLLVRDERKNLPDDHSPLALRQATNQVLERAIDELAEQESVQAAVLRARFVEGAITRRVAVKLHASPDQVNRWQRSAVINLSQILRGREMASRQKRIQGLEAELPPPSYLRLFGLDQARRAVVGQLLRPLPPWVIIITGIGGIGKTSLADAAVRQAIQEATFEHVFWLRVGSQRLSGAPLGPEQNYEQLLTALAERLWPETPGGEATKERLARVRQALKERACLVVIDNLETAAGTAYLVERVGDLTGPSKFLLTSRARPGVTSAAYLLSLAELPLEDAADLLRHQAEVVGLTELAQAKAEDAKAVHEVTGGNPLALKLVVSLATILPLPQILAGLAQSQPGRIEELYRHIYWDAWRTLSPDAQVLLQAMPLVAESGALPEHMQAISGLSSEQLWPAITELASRSLLEVQGTVHERRYGIHRLTETFLRTEIVHWTEE